MPQIPLHRSGHGRPPRRFPHARLTRDIIGVFFDVYNELGGGLFENVYRSAMDIVLTERGLRSRSEVEFHIHFHQHRIGTYRADIVVEDSVILELKAGTALPPGSKGQLINYLRLSRLEVGLLLFFGPNPEFERVVASRPGNDGQ
jgi:GxxExxY protein